MDNFQENVVRGSGLLRAAGRRIGKGLGEWRQEEMSSLREFFQPGDLTFHVGFGEAFSMPFPMAPAGEKDRGEIGGRSFSGSQERATLMALISWAAQVSGSGFGKISPER